MGYRIREARERRRLSQYELSEKSGVSRGIINGLETGRRVITTSDTLIKIANALECDIDEIFYADKK